MIWRILGLLLVIAVGLLVAQGVLHPPAPPPEPRPAHADFAPAPPSAPPPVSLAGAPSAASDAPVSDIAVAPPTRPDSPCAASAAFAAAASLNAASLQTAAWSVFGRPETGWEIYAPLTANEIGTGCAPAEPGFAEALAGWQGAHHLPADGVMDPVTLKALNTLWIKRRPFVAANAHGACPPPPSPDRLAWAAKGEGYSGKAIQLRVTTLDAYRQMVAAARQDVPAMATDKQLLTIFSGYRDPVDDAVRCALAGDCGTIVRANCSAHRTGLAIDVYVGHAPGMAPESSADPNRLFQTKTPLYQWMVRNAGRFGFVNYPFEPWHWEWTGEAI